MRLVAVAGVLLAALTSAQSEAKLLANELRRDPAEVLREIGSAPSQEAARELASRLLGNVASPVFLRLLRFGLGSENERAVFGAAILNDSPGLPVPELRNAATRVIPRFGDHDCPVTLQQVVRLCGSVDVPAIIERIPHLPANVAESWLGEVHRLVRPEHVPALCALALRSKGNVACAAFEDAWFPAQFGGQHVPLVVATWLQLVGAQADPDREGLPGALTAALRSMIDHSALPPDSAPGQENRQRSPRLPRILCSRWLLASRVAPVDEPLLQRLIEERLLRPVALSMLGQLSDPASASLLRAACLDANAEIQCAARMALAKRGDAAALEELLSGAPEEVCCGLAVASPQRRRDFAARCLALPPADAITQLRAIAGLQGDVLPAPIPPFDDAWFTDLEPMAAEARRLDVRVLRTLIAGFPTCATIRLADQLLANPASSLFGEHSSDLHEMWPGGVGFRGVWPFLEVTRPDAFLTRLREGVQLEDRTARDTCADLLLRLGDREATTLLLAWAQLPSDDDKGERWLQLAQLGGDQVRTALLAKIETATIAARAQLLPALAVLGGMPVAIARQWRVPKNDADTVWSQVQGGEVARAFLATNDRTTLSWMLSDLLPWADPRIQDYVRQLERDGSEQQPDSLMRARLCVGVYRGDPEAITTLRSLLLDGRYVTHHNMTGDILTGGRDRKTLSFWIDELGTNCCRAVVASEALTHLLGDDPPYSDEDPEPLALRLRRNFLPLLDRLHWSKLANGYVVAGR